MRIIIQFLLFIGCLFLLALSLYKVGHESLQIERMAMLSEKATEFETKYQEELALHQKTKDEFESIVTLKKQVEEELEEKKNEANELARELALEQQKRKDLERKLKIAEQKVKTLEKEVTEEKEKNKALTQRLERMANRLEQQEHDKTSLLNRLNTVISERDSIQGELEKIKEKSKTQVTLEDIHVAEEKQFAGLVLNVNEKFGFCIISIGQTEGIVPGIELIAYRGSQLVAKLKVDRVFEKMSSAKIVSLQGQETLQIEDLVRKF